MGTVTSKTHLASLIPLPRKSITPDMLTFVHSVTFPAVHFGEERQMVEGNNIS
jgi:hypothetical protein